MLNSVPVTSTSILLLTPTMNGRFLSVSTSKLNRRFVPSTAYCIDAVRAMPSERRFIKKSSFCVF